MTGKGSLPKRGNLLLVGNHACRQLLASDRSDQQPTVVAGPAASHRLKNAGLAAGITYSPLARPTQPPKRPPNLA